MCLFYNTLFLWIQRVVLSDSELCGSVTHIQWAINVQNIVLLNKISEALLLINSSSNTSMFFELIYLQVH
jgi:hypothetical protein